MMENFSPHPSTPADSIRIIFIKRPLWRHLAFQGTG
jgi:hypothetical protein